MSLWVRHEDLVGACENFNIFRFSATCIDITFFPISSVIIFFKNVFYNCTVKLALEEIKIFSSWLYILIAWIRKELG